MPAVKKRIGMVLAEHLENNEIRYVSRRVPARMYDLIHDGSAEKMSIKVIYKPGIENESVVGDKKYVLNMFTMFTTQNAIKDALTY